MKDDGRREIETSGIFTFGGGSDPGANQPPGEAASPSAVEVIPAEPGRPLAQEAPPAGGRGGKGPGAGLGFLELIYGVLFDPVKTFGRIAGSPPMGKIFLVFSVVKVLSVLVFVMGGLSSSKFIIGGLPGPAEHGMSGMLRAVAPAAAFLSLIYEYVKWFVYGGILYLLAEFFGGRGRAVGVLAATGLASLPTLVILPLQVLVIILAGGGWIAGPAGVLFWLATLVWGTVLVVVGLKETQHLSTGRAVAAALIPAAAVVVLIVLMLAVVVAAAAPMALFLQYFDDISY